VGRDGEQLPAIANRTAGDRYGFESMTLEALRHLWWLETRPKTDAGECCCPVFDDGSLGFRQRCPVHGGRSRADFARLTALRAEVASRCRVEAGAGGIIGRGGRS
jgi:hypothetical protein